MLSLSNTKSHLALILLLNLCAARMSTAFADTILTIDDPRPIAEGVQKLVSDCGYVITYEDPRYEYSDDLEDVTDAVRNPLHKFAPGEVPKRVLVPRGATLALDVPVVRGSQDMTTVLQKLVQMARDHGGHFRVEQSGAVFHIVPTEVRDINGNWVPNSSIMDIEISIPDKNRTEYEMYKAIFEAVGSAAHVLIVEGNGAYPQGIGSTASPETYHLGADHELARSVLLRVLATTDPVHKRTWRLLYDYSDKKYYLNISNVPDVSAQSRQSQTALPAPVIVPCGGGSPTPALTPRVFPGGFPTLSSTGYPLAPPVHWARLPATVAGQPVHLASATHSIAPRSQTGSSNFLLSGARSPQDSNRNGSLAASQLSEAPLRSDVDEISGYWY